MHMFFAALKKGGSFHEAERERFVEHVRREVCFSRHVTRVLSLAPAPDAIVVGLSNEPEGGWYETPRGHAFVSGYCSELEALRRLRADLDLASHVSALSGRFSALIVDQAEQCFALATPPARIDSIFGYETDDMLYWGNQASVLSLLTQGELHYAPERLLTFANAGFFGNDNTPFVGVDAVPSFTTVRVQRGRVYRSSRPVYDLKTRDADWKRSIALAVAPRLGFSWIPRSLDENLRTLAARYVDAFAPLHANPGRLELALTGGMDSRMLLAGALSAKLELDCFTVSKGALNRADVWVAQRVAEYTGVPHRLVDPAPAGPAKTAGTNRLLYKTVRTLAATDGMLGGTSPVIPNFAYRGGVSMSGQGGEILRGGYGEKVMRPTRALGTHTLRALWNHTPAPFHRHLVEQQKQEISRLITSFPNELSTVDLLDCVYVMLRCGRWVAGSTSASTGRVRPLLDNAVVAAALAVPARVKRHHIPHQRIIAQLLPGLAELPVANKFWYGTTTRRRRAIVAKWPQAFTEKKSRAEKRTSSSLSAENEAEIKRYLLEGDRLTALERLVDVDATVGYLRQKPTNPRTYGKLMMGLYSAAVLLCEDWRKQQR